MGQNVQIEIMKDTADRGLNVSSGKREDTAGAARIGFDSLGIFIVCLDLFGEKAEQEMAACIKAGSLSGKFFGMLGK